jgi:hypothetical protein
MASLVIAGAIMAVGSVAKAAIQSHAAKDAAKTQVAGTVAAQKQLDTTMQPYLDSGKVAQTTLMSMMGLGGPSAATPNPQPGLVQPRSAAARNVKPDSINSRERELDRSVEQTTAGTPLRNAMDAQPGSAGSAYMVRMQAPTGEVMDIPAAQIPHFQQRGARVMQ